jgi:hypothetical protein
MVLRVGWFVQAKRFDCRVFCTAILTEHNTSTLSCLICPLIIPRCLAAVYCRRGPQQHNGQSCVAHSASPASPQRGEASGGGGQAAACSPCGYLQASALPSHFQFDSHVFEALKRRSYALESLSVAMIGCPWRRSSAERPS